MSRKPPSISVIVQTAIPLPGTPAGSELSTGTAGLLPASATEAWRHLTVALGATVPAHINGALDSARRLRGIGA